MYVCFYDFYDLFSDAICDLLYDGRVAGYTVMVDMHMVEYLYV